MRKLLATENGETSTPPQGRCIELKRLERRSLRRGLSSCAPVHYETK